MSGFVYLDNSATTKPCKEAVSEMVLALQDGWGNPSSLHSLGFASQLKIDAVRESVAKILHCRPDEIFFTSGGTESNNTAVFGAVKSRRRYGKRIVTTSIEHPSVLEPILSLKDEGFEVITLRPDNTGSICEEELVSAITKDTILVSVMAVNNETGAFQPVKAAATAIKQAGSRALLHCDAVQAFGKTPLNVKDLGVDLLSFSGHKIHASKGVGGLFVKKGSNLKPFMLGGGQERGVRSGTEACAAICGLGGAVSALPPATKQLSLQKKLWEYAKGKLLETELVVINSSDDVLPYVLNFSVPGFRSETLLHFLESKNIFVSSGSACSKGKGSYVLSEMGLEGKRVDSAIRISFSRFSTTEDIDALIGALKEAATKLRKVK